MRIDNVTDRKYIGSVIVADGNRRFYEPAPGRNWLVGVSAAARFLSVACEPPAKSSVRMITVTINGEPRQFERALHFAELVERLGLAGKRIAVERNGEIVPRSQFAARRSRTATARDRRRGRRRLTSPFPHNSTTAS